MNGILVGGYEVEGPKLVVAVDPLVGPSPMVPPPEREMFPPSKIGILPEVGILPSMVLTKKGDDSDLR